MPVSVRCVNPKCGVKLNVSEKVNRAKAHCPKCGSKLPDDEDIAADFLSGPSPPRRTRHTFEQEDRRVFEEAPKATVEMSQPKKEKEHSNGCLRVVSFAILLFGTLLSVIVLSTASRSPAPGWTVVIAAVLFGATLFICNLIGLLIRIEKNTRH